MGKVQICLPPWGLACAQDIFQQPMDKILIHSNGMIGITDDVDVHGKDEKEHGKHFHNFMSVACKHGLVFNKDKYALKQTYVVFFRCVYDANRAHHDTEKVSTVHKMPVPETATQLQKFLRLVTYLSPFIPPLSSFTTPLCELLRKGTEFIWNNFYQESFDKVKSMVCKDTHCSTSMSASLSLSKLIHLKKA